MNTRTLVFFFALACASAGAAAAPTQDQARALASQMEQFVSQGALWGGKTQAQRVQLIRQGADLQRQAKQLFGDDVLGRWSACTKAAMLLQDHLQGLNYLARAADGSGGQLVDVTALSTLRSAFAFGQEHAGCRQAIDALGTRQQAAR
jgi:hypothetical protein